MQILNPIPSLKPHISISYRHFATRSRQSVRFLSSTRSTPQSIDFQGLDWKWQHNWREIPRRPAKDGSPKSYVLAMFPYPSGALHMGHLRVYTITDVIARFKRMQGHRLLYPMGWDAFGLPAENAAIERGLEPASWTQSNIAKMKGQLRAMNGDIDWSRELTTCDPSFYKHTQRLFLLLHQHGLAYQAESLVNYDPIDQTVLANEQVDANGFSWRSGAKVEKLNLKQWFLKITAFKEALLDDLDLLQQWPERVTTMQRNWLGRSKGANIKFDVVDSSGNAGSLQPISVFTTRPDTLLGVQYLCLSAKHPLVEHLSEQDAALNNFVNSLDSLPPESKQGYRLQGVYANGPLRFLDNVPESSAEPLPIYVSPYVVDSYGEGAVMGVPAHDSRDWEFWKQNSRGAPPRQVVFPPSEEAPEPAASIEKAFTSLGVLGKSYGKYAGLGSEEATQMIVSDLVKAGSHAQPSETWRLRDWLISRQRYWGTPIPIVHCPNCGAAPVPVDQLPIELPKIDGSSLKHRTGNPLDHAHDWVNTSCPKCSGPAKRDTDTMDTFMDSSWYMFRFTDPDNKSEPFSPQLADSNMPVDVYLGGVEHAILHLLYARFIGKFLATTSLWPAGAAPDIRGEPFKQQISQGMVHGKTFSDPDTGRFLRQDEVDLNDPAQPKTIASGRSPTISFEKMSKSKHNGVDPLSFIAKYGADVTRAHILFQAPVSEVLEWEEDRISGIQRWLGRIWRLVQSASASFPVHPACEPQPKQPFPFRVRRWVRLSSFEKTLKLATQRTASSITTSLSTTHALNTCISDLMSLTNTIVQPQGLFESQNPGTVYHTLSNLLRLLAPFTPAFAEECWQVLHSNIPYPYLPKYDHVPQQDLKGNGEGFSYQNSIFNYPIPMTFSLAKLEAWAASEKQTCAIMENGKLRATIEIEPIADTLSATEKEERVLDQIRKTTDGLKWLERASEVKGNKNWWKRIVVVQGGKTVNFVG